MRQELIIKELVAPVINGLGYELVRIQISDEGTKTVQIMVERLDGVNLSVDDCSLLSNEVSVILDVNDPINDNYLLEVSSPGIDRPLVKLKDYETYAGFHARINTNAVFEGRKDFKGKLTGIEGNNIKIIVKEKTYLLPFDKIEKAKLLLTQELLDSATKN
jgi:ribosome maturation factor RimP